MAEDISNVPAVSEGNRRDFWREGYLRIQGVGRAGLIALLVVLGLVAIESLRLGIAGLIVESGQSEMDRQAGSTRSQSMAEIGRVAGYFSDSLRYGVNNPWALEGLGNLDLARMRVSKVPHEALAFARSARLRFSEALVQRPTSPFLWSNLALAKLYLDEIDEEFFQALRHADALGPWEPTSQEVVLFAGLGGWEKLDPKLREILAGVVARGGARNGPKMFKIVKSYRRFDLVCPLTSYHVIAGADCLRAAGAAGSAPPTKTERGKR